jgi:DNA-directed RNA polymerase subunit RPC12/RpoP
MSATPDTKHDPKKKPFVCVTCGREFATRQGLGAHSRFHLSTQNPCPECSREFTSAQGLALHRFRVHGVGQGKSDKKKPARPRNKRSYARHKKGGEEPANVEVPNFCPHCGFSLHAVILAMNFKK